MFSNCISYFVILHVLLCSEQIVNLHCNGRQFLCIEVHRDCSSWQQCWTDWRSKAIWSEGFYCYLARQSWIYVVVLVVACLHAVQEIPESNLCCIQFVYSEKSLWYAALATGCTVRLDQPSILWGWVKIHGNGWMFGI